MPIGWAKAMLGDLCDINPKHERELSGETEVSFVPMAAVDDGHGEIIGTETRRLDQVRSGYTHFANEDVLFAKITPCMENGKASIAQGLKNGLGCGSTEFFVLRSRGGVSPAFLHRFLRQEGYRQAAHAAMTGVVGQARVPRDFIAQTDLPVPPLAEQKRIVATIEELTTRSWRAKEALDAVPPLLDQFRQSILAAAFRGDLTADWRAKNLGVERSDESIECRAESPSLAENADNPIQLPAGWTWSTVVRVSAFATDGTHQPPPTTTSGIPFVGIRNILDGRLDWSSVDCWVSLVTFRALTNRYRAVRGDVLYATVGATFGQSVLVEDDREFVFQRHIAHV